jgi:hypothetical protein
MKTTNEFVDRICSLVPGATPDLLQAILTAIGPSHIFFAEGAGQAVVEGKSVFPDYLQIQITSAYEAGNLAQQLMRACTDALANGGKLRAPVLLLLAGAAEVGE